MRRFIPFMMALGVLVGCGRVVPPARDGRESSDEAAVKSYILANANDPRSVEFVRWGPHDNNLFEGTKFDGRVSAKVLRVVYREKNEHGAIVIRDRLAHVTDGKIAAVKDNQFGDNFKETLRFYAKDFTGDDDQSSGPRQQVP